MSRLVVLWMVISLVVAGIPFSGRAGETVGDADAAYVETDSSDGDDDSSLNKEFALGLFLVVVAVLLWVGFREDIGWWSRSANSEPVQVCDASRVSLQAVNLDSSGRSAGAALAFTWDF